MLYVAPRLFDFGRRQALLLAQDLIGHPQLADVLHQAEIAKERDIGHGELEEAAEAGHVDRRVERVRMGVVALLPQARQEHERVGIA
jgi:hypothetical protein